jgi:hypothetical protein
MKNDFYAWHWLNLEKGDTVYYYSHNKLYSQIAKSATAKYYKYNFGNGKLEDCLAYIEVTVEGKNNRTTTFRIDHDGTLELGYGRDHKGNLRFSCLGAVKEYFEKKKKESEWRISYYNAMVQKNNKIIQQIDDLKII